MSNPKIKLNGAVLGPSGVGKSTICRTLEKGRPTGQTERVTTGFDIFCAKRTIENYDVTFEIRDTAGMERFRHSLGNSYYRQLDFCVLVFELTSGDMLPKMKGWLDEARQKINCDDPDDFPYLLLGNKCDAVAERAITTSQIKQWMAENKVKHFFEVSAQTGANIEAAFREIAKKAIAEKRKKEEKEKKEKKDEPEEEPIKINNQKSKKSGGCPC